TRETISQVSPPPPRPPNARPARGPPPPPRAGAWQILSPVPAPQLPFPPVTPRHATTGGALTLTTLRTLFGSAPPGIVCSFMVMSPLVGLLECGGERGQRLVPEPVEIRA